MKKRGILSNYPKQLVLASACDPFGTQVGCNVLGGIQPMHERMVEEVLGLWVFAYDASPCPFLVANDTFQLVGGGGLKMYVVASFLAAAGLIGLKGPRAGMECWKPV